MNCGVMLHGYKSNQRIDHAICSLHQTNPTLTTKPLLVVQVLSATRLTRRHCAGQSGEALNSIWTKT
jgi:hypothetical protein